MSRRFVSTTHLRRKTFFGWQAGAFLALAIIVGTRRPAVAGGVLGGYLVLSALALLACSRNAALMATFAIFVLWALSATVGMRMAIERVVGPRYATWGVAAATVYAALIPICFFLGLIRAITPSNVAALAVATGLPGAVACLRRLPALPGDLKRQLGQWDVLDMCLAEAIWLLVAVGFVFASTSEVLSDSVRVHLPYIHRVVADHGVSHPYACWHQLQPMAVQTCCAALAVVGSDATAKWFSWLALPCLALLAAEEVCLRSALAEARAVRRRGGPRRSAIGVGFAVAIHRPRRGAVMHGWIRGAVPRLASAVLARHLAFGGRYGGNGRSEVHRFGVRPGVGSVLNGRSAVETRLADRPAVGDGGRRVVRGDGLALVCLRVSGHGQSVLSLSAPLVPVALLGQRLHLAAVV